MWVVGMGVALPELVEGNGVWDVWLFQDVSTAVANRRYGCVLLRIHQARWDGAYDWISTVCKSVLMWALRCQTTCKRCSSFTQLGSRGAYCLTIPQGACHARVAEHKATTRLSEEAMERRVLPLTRSDDQSPARGTPPQRQKASA